MKAFIITLVALFFFSGKGPAVKKEFLTGKHWAGSCVSTPCDTIAFRAYKKYDGARYQWGGYAEGIEFHQNGTAQTFSNVMCSTESSPVDSYSSAWELKSDTLTIDSHYTITKYKVISLSQKELRLLNLGFTEKKL